MSELTEKMIDSIFAENYRRAMNPAEVTADDMRYLYASWNTHHDFKPGDIVKLKPAMQGFLNAPDYDQPCVVMELTDPVRYPEESPNKPQFGAILDIVVGHIAQDGSLFFIYCDRRQFEPFE